MPALKFETKIGRKFPSHLLTHIVEIYVLLNSAHNSSNSNAARTFLLECYFYN